MSSKRQMTMAKRAREQAVKERRALKQEKKLAARFAKAAEGMPPEPPPNESPPAPLLSESPPAL